MTDATSPVRPGDRIAGKYRVDGVLGAGGMGVVVAATHEQLDQRVALKFLLPEALGRADIVARFLREARAAAKIRSEHVCRVLDVDTLPDGAPYMVMELLEGEDLERVVEQRGPLPTPEAVGYVLEACEALAEAHAIGIVHRDLKPANLFLARRSGGRSIVKVLDFGISKLPLSEKEQALTQEAAVMGSPAYMSPEQLRASRDVDARSDLYSMGVVLFQLLTTQPPFTSDSMAVLVASVLTERPPPIGPMRRDVPPGLDAVIARCLEKEPASRYADVAELANALRPFAAPQGEASVAAIEHALGRVSGDGYPRASVVTAGELTPTYAQPFSSTIATANQPPKRLWIAGFVAGLAVTGAVLALVVFGRGGARPAATLPSAEPVQASSAMPTPSAVAVVAPATASPVASTTASTASTDAAPSARPSPTAEALPIPTAPKAKPAPRPHASAAPACKVVAYFDSDGNKHFKQECP